MFYAVTKGTRVSIHTRTPLAIRACSPSTMWSELSDDASKLRDQPPLPPRRQSYFFSLRDVLAVPLLGAATPEPVSSHHGRFGCTASTVRGPFEWTSQTFLKKRSAYI